jgi:hypothetical protein
LDYDENWWEEPMDPCASAVKSKYLVLLQWAYADGCPWDAWALVQLRVSCLRTPE